MPFFFVFRCIETKSNRYAELSGSSLVKVDIAIKDDNWRFKIYFEKATITVMHISLLLHKIPDRHHIKKKIIDLLFALFKKRSFL